MKRQTKMRLAARHRRELRSQCHPRFCYKRKWWTFKANYQALDADGWRVDWGVIKSRAMRAAHTSAPVFGGVGAGADGEEGHRKWTLRCPTWGRLWSLLHSKNSGCPSLKYAPQRQGSYRTLLGFTCFLLLTLAVRSINLLKPRTLYHKDCHF